MLITIIVSSIIISAFSNANETYSIHIDYSSSEAKIEPFWQSTGFSPPKGEVDTYLLSQDSKTNIAIIGALPNRGIKQIRVHWLLDLIKTDNSDFNYVNLDLVLDWMHFQSLSPRFELMGFPNNLFSKNVKNVTTFWSHFTETTVKRYIDRYGLNIVEKWSFETWNEPDLKMYNILNYTLNEYKSYVFGCRKGLDKAVKKNDSVLRLGGPAGVFKDFVHHPLCWGLLEMCNSIRDCPLQYISFHKKGDGSAGRLVSKDLQFLDHFHETYPNLKHIPIANDEADILTNWSLEEEWRADAKYAALVARVIIEHYREVIQKRGIAIEILSNDNGFMNYNPHFFTQRTLLARFQMNNTIPPHTQFFFKPVYSVMGLLSYLKGHSVAINKTSPLINAIASRTRRTFSALVVYSNETEADFSDTTIRITLKNLSVNCKYVIYTINNLETNPYSVWNAAGAPVYPDTDLRWKMRSQQLPFRVLGPDSANSTNLEIVLNITMPSVYLIHACNSSIKAPGPTTHLQVRMVQDNEVLLIWKDDRVKSRCIKTYVVEFCAGSEYTRINEMDVIFLSYQYELPGDVGLRGWFRVKAVDYWNRSGPYSDPVYYQE
ncbi:PREDICTED: alpha-L-iduronidase [Nicrophorus vespilloides]|uniref:Alpha-L-iduronidase n=1 Tax=Nicrophorus vespilloides TaxID=110193 RepID=A0ABM1M4F2_NICVS|nr:PREDICTED: alpha-L-iduronidase [Nicrophorus vespilloides]